MNEAQVKELILQSLEHERGGVLVYETALQCVVNEDLKSEWEEYLEQTETHVQALEEVCEAMGLDPDEKTPGCKIVAHVGNALVKAMKMAMAEGDPAAAELVACDCVVLAETKDHADWKLLGKCADNLTGDAGKLLKKAYKKIEDEEDEHVYHSKGWGRELWLKSLGLKSMLPPPEEVKDVKSAVEAAKAEKASNTSRRASR